MATVQPNEIPDDELILRRISDKAATPKARHFKLRTEELGISCSRKNELEQPEDLLQGAGDDAWIAEARVGDLRALGLEVLIVEMEGIPGHCEIRAGQTEINSQDMRDRLAEIFKRLE